MKNLLYILLILATSIACKNSNSDVKPLNLQEDKNPSLSIRRQFYSINNQRDTIINCSKGSKIYFPANCFDGLSEMIEKERITIEVIEAFSPHEIISNNWSTETNSGRVLETDGMLFINATLGNDTLQLKPNKPLQILMPNSHPNNDRQFSLFSGDLASGRLLWDSIPLSEESKIEFDTVYLGENNFDYKLVPIDAGWVFHRDKWSHIFSTNKLQFLNCDRYPELYSPEYQCEVKIKKRVSEIVYSYLFLENKKVMGSMSTWDRLDSINPQIFIVRPRGERAKLFSYYTKNGHFYYSSQELLVTKDTLLNLKYEMIDQSELEEYLSKITWP